MKSFKRKSVKEASPLMLVVFLSPAILTFLALYAYPASRTFIMSFFDVRNVTDPISTWSFNGITNYLNAFSSQLFVTSLSNLAKLWFFGGIIVMFFALLFAVILTNNIKGKTFFRSMIYMPNMISAVAMGTMWLYFVFNKDSIGLLNGILTSLGFENVLWLSPTFKFGSMLVAYSFGSIGYHMLIFIGGIDRIGKEYYEAARIEGASLSQQFFKITLPLLKGSIRTNLIMWTVSSVSFFIWAQVFDPINLSNETVFPLNYMYQTVFGGGFSAGALKDSGVGAAIGVMMAILVILAFIGTNFIVKNDDVEF